MTEKCIVCYECEESDVVRVNCPNCGRFLKWNGWKEGYSCVCRGIITIFGSGDPEVNDEDSALRVCKIAHLKEATQDHEEDP